MFVIDRVTFISTIRWPNNGPTDSLTKYMWHKVAMTDQGIMFTHIDGYMVFVPYGNVRWISGKMMGAPTAAKRETPRTTTPIELKTRGAKLKHSP